MKILRIVEKILFIVAAAVGVVSIAMSQLFDEGAGVQGMFTAATAYYLVGAGTSLALLGIGALLYYIKNEVAARVGTGLLVGSFSVLFGAGLYMISIGTKSITAILAMAAGILFMVSLLFRLIRWIVGVAKPEVEESDPDNDRRIVLIKKWKALLEQDIITKEEFEEKRKNILAQVDAKKQ